MAQMLPGNTVAQQAAIDMAHGFTRIYTDKKLKNVSEATKSVFICVNPRAKILADNANVVG